MLSPIYYNPYVYIAPWLDSFKQALYNLFSPPFFDNYILMNHYLPPTSFRLSSLWRYPTTYLAREAGLRPEDRWWGYQPDLTQLAFGIQDAAIQSEYWMNLERLSQDSYYRNLLTASSPPAIV